MTISVQDVSMVFGSDKTVALRNVSFEVAQGEFIALTGRSGSGKSTLLYLMSSLDQPSSGDVLVDGASLTRAKSHYLHELRNTQIGFVFQFHYLLPELSALENVLMPAHKTGQHKTKRALAEELLERFEIRNKLNRLPRQLSGGEQQRVAIARALIMQPKYLFADEPTGNLDSTNGEMVMKIFQDINKSQHMTIVMVTHEPDFAAYASRQIHLADGKLVSDSAQERIT